MPFSAQPSVNDLGEWKTYTPVLTGSGGNPTLGSGSEQYGHYIVADRAVFISVRVQLGAAGFANGTGTLFCSLPIAAEGGYFQTIMTVGAGWIRDSSLGDVYNMAAILGTGDGAFSTVQFRPDSTTAELLTYTSPFTLGQSDDMGFSGFYKRA